MSDRWAQQQFEPLVADDRDLAARVAGDPPLVVAYSTPVGEVLARVGRASTIAVVDDEVELFRVERFRVERR